FMGPGAGAKVSDADKRLLMAATYVILASGEADRAVFDNVYFVTPSNRIVMFAPDLPDKISFYNHDAPATLDLTSKEFLTMSLPANDPAGTTGCTKLPPLLTDRTHRSMVS